MRYLKLLLIRHAESIGNVQKVMEGQQSTPLSDVGHQQAQQLAIALHSSSELPTHLYSSPLLRAQQTAETITTTLKKTNHPFIYQETKALCEIHQGIFQGLTWPQAQTKYPDLCRQLTTTLDWQPIPEAETPATARNRAKSWVKYLLKNHQPKDIVWTVSHAGFLQHLIAVVMGCDRTWQFRIDHTAIFEFWLSHSAAKSEPNFDSSLKGDFLETNRFNTECWILRRFNDSNHRQEASEQQS